MLRDENRGISGNGQKSRKHAKFHNGNGDEQRGGGTGDSNLTSQKTGGWVTMQHYPWDGKKLQTAKPGGLGIIPIEDQFKAISTNTKEVYVSVPFASQPKMKESGTVVKVYGQNTKGSDISLTVQLCDKDAILECIYESIVIIWVAKKWIIESTY